MKLPLRIENKQYFKVMANQSQMEMIKDLNVIQENLARDLHDDLSQYITTMSLYITGILSSKNLDSAHHQAHEMLVINSGMNYSLKKLLANLRSKDCFNNTTQHVTNEDYFSLVKDWAKLNSSVSFNYGIEIPSELDSRSLLQCYQILKEALSNITRHANAKHVSVQIGKNVSSFLLKITDDGVGFKTSNINEYKFGILGMRERANQIGAVINIASVPNHGTSIYVHVPLELTLYE
tara:strand:+ start:1861 stop:2568 length:708 start_codon:yes stop_codon:yes gene_type:complete